MRPVLVVIMLTATALGAAATRQAPRQDVENVAAFTRLYGVVRYFYPSDAAASLDWNRFAVHGVKQVRAARDGKALQATLQALFTPLGSGLEIGQRLSSPPAPGSPDDRLIAWRYLGAGMAGASVSSPYKGKRTHRPMVVNSSHSAPTAELFDSPSTPGAHADIDLGSGLKARVPLALAEGQAIDDVTRSSSLAGLRAAVASVTDMGDQPQLDTRLADVVVAWNVFRHFYPYWTESRVDWDARLRPQIERMFGANTRATHYDALRLLVADVHDGHGSVFDTRGTAERGWLPVQFGIIEGQLVVTATGAPADAPVGAIVSTLDGVPAGQRMSAATGLASGTAQWKETRALREISACPLGAVVKLVIDSGAGPRSGILRCDAKQPPPEKRPEPVVQLRSGVWYVDLTRAKMVDVAPVIAKLAQATGVVFDVRGYPTDAGARILPYLLETSEADRWMHVNKIVGPFGQSAGWQSFGWNLKPMSPRVAGKVVFLTDVRAISYAESVMGYVADRKLATIVGGTTAGANGNVVTFTVPGGFRIAFTGMRVTRHDGQTPHHLAGVKPDVPTAPTIAGLRQGRDEVLDAAVALLRGQ